MKHGRETAGNLCGWCQAAEQRAEIARLALGNIAKRKHGIYCRTRDNPPEDCTCTVGVAKAALVAIGVASVEPAGELDGQDSLL